MPSPARRLAPILSVGLAAAACSVGGAESSPPTAGSEVSAEGSVETDLLRLEVTTAPADSAAVPAEDTIVAQARGAEVVAYAEPSIDAAVTANLEDPVANGGPLVLQVISPVTTPTPEWLEVRLPIRPNGTTGWIRSADVELATNPYRIQIDTSDYSLRLFHRGELVIATTIAVGTGDTPTPYGEFYLSELLQPPSPDGPYGPFAFGLSGFSDVLTSFAGGDGVIGIHGTDDPAALGSNVSHGCVRVENEVIEEMAAVVPLGTPVTISE